MIEVSRWELRRVVVAVDPAVTHNERSDDTGIVVVARGPHQESTCKLEKLTGHCPGHAYVLDDRTCHVGPHEWAKRAIDAYDEWGANLIVAEVNNGGDLVAQNIHAVRSDIPYREVRASRGKKVRAEPVATLYEQGRVHHMGVFADLETQMTTWNPDDESPDRMDALVWGVVALSLVAAQGAAFMSMWREQTKRVHHGTQSGLRLIRGGNCGHRWKGEHCVFCGATKQAS